MATVISITSEEKILVTLSPKTAAGNPAGVESPSWEVTSGDAKVEPSPDGLSAYLISGDAAGISEIKVSADADLGEGVVEVSESIQLAVVSPLADNLGITVGAPEPK